MKTRTMFFASCLSLLLGCYVTSAGACKTCSRGQCVEASSGWLYCTQTGDGYCELSVSCAWATDPTLPPSTWYWSSDGTTLYDDDPHHYEERAPVGSLPSWLGPAPRPAAVTREETAQEDVFLERPSACGPAADAFAIDVQPSDLKAIAERAPRQAEVLLFATVLSKVTGHAADSGEITRPSLAPEAQELREAISQQRLPKSARADGPGTRFSRKAIWNATGELMLLIEPDQGSLVPSDAPLPILAARFRRTGAQVVDDGSAVPLYAMTAWAMLPGANPNTASLVPEEQRR